ncbi:MAG TPA: VTT domain-containing protein [Terriglobales bacterium]|nr:VTT domain-containing protein [Terriglobales bacterium]
MHLSAAIWTLKSMRPAELASFAAKKGLLHWWISLGGPSLILIGLIDNSVIPLPGSTDVLTVVLAAHHREPWIYYAALATVGAVLGGYITYNMARKTGKETLEKRFSKKKVDKVYAMFEKWGFAGVAIPAMLPPPFPIVPMLLAAGALQYPTRKFLAALSVGRGARYTILAFLGAHYGRHVVSFFMRYYKPTLIVLIALAAIGGLFALYAYWRGRKTGGAKRKTTSPRATRVGHGAV